MLAANVKLQDAELRELFSAMFSAEHYRDSTTNFPVISKNRITSNIGYAFGS